MSKSMQRLGRGLSGIVGARPLVHPPYAAPPAEAADGGDGSTATVTAIRQMPIDAVVPNPRQPRSHFDDAAIGQLADSIRANGVLQPLLVRPLPTGQFELVAGERRLRAARRAGLQSVPAIVRTVGDAESLEMALIENLQREDLDAVERATAYRQYLDTFQTTPEALAERIGESRANVANYLRILKLADEIKEMIRASRLGMGQARAIAGVPDPERQLALARLAVRRNLSVRQVEELAKTATERTVDVTVSKAVGRDRHVQQVEEALSKALGVSVVLKPGKGKNTGRIVIRYKSLEEFDRIAQRLGGTAYLE